jgi:hypothetical protein
MRADDFEQIFGAAFDRIEPKDEGEREKLEKMRARFRQITAESQAEIEKVQKTISAISNSEASKLRKEMAADLKHQTERAMDEAIEHLREQTKMISMIASRTRQH